MMSKKVIFNIVPVSGRRSETFIKQRFNENAKLGYSNIIYTDAIVDRHDSNRHLTIIGRGRYRNKFNQILFNLKDIFNGNYNTIYKNNLKSSLLKHRPEIIHLHFGYQAFSLLEVLNDIKISSKVIVSLHGSDVLSFVNKNKRQGVVIGQLIEKHNALITVPTEFLLKKVKEKYHISSPNIIVVPNAFEGFFSNENEVTVIKSQSQLDIVNVSRLINWKGHKFLLCGFAKFIHKYKPENCKLRIIGEGEEKVNLSILAEELNISAYVEFLGALPHREVAEIMKKSNVFIHTAIKDPVTEQEESFGIVLLEAIASKLFCITTSSGGLKDVIGNLDVNEENMIVIEEKSAKAVYKGLEKVFVSGGKVDNEYVKNRVDAFSVEKVNKIWKKIYNSKTK